MRLEGKELLLLVSDGVELSEYEQLRDGFLEEKAKVWTTSPQDFTTVETVQEGKRGKDILIDLPFQVVGKMRFDGLIIPDGVLSAKSMRKDSRVLELVAEFHQKGLPIFASGTAVEVLYDSKVLSQHVIVREGTPLSSFLDQAVSILGESQAKEGLRSLYRATI